MNGKRIVNVRPLFVSLVGVICGILFSYLVVKSVYLNTFSLYLLPIMLLVTIGIISVVMLFIRSDNKVIATVHKYAPSVIAFMLLFIVAAGFTTLRFGKYLGLKSYNSEYTITLIASNVYDYGSYMNVSADEFYVDDIKVKEKATVTVFYETSEAYQHIKIGQLVTFNGSAKLNPLFDNNSNLVDYLYGRAYTMSVLYDNVTLGESKATVGMSVRGHVYDVLQNNMNSANAGIAYAMLFGSKEHLDSNISQMFSYSGIAHVLAVSGLHVGMLAGLISWLLKRLKAKRWVNLVVVGVFLLIYCYLCGFAPSVVRASIMSTISILAFVLGKQYDVLNSLSLSAIITLLINPLDLFSIGFQLSYLCVLCIITLSNSITRLLKRAHIPKAIAGTFAISVCINMVILPVSANAFNNVSLIGSLANVVILPLFGVAFPILFVLTVLVSILPFMGGILIVPDAMLHVIKYIANFFANINILNFKFFNLSYLILLSIVLVLLAIKYLGVNKAIKASIISAFVVVIIATFVVNVIPSRYNETYALSYQNGSNNAITTINGNNYMIGTQNKYLSTMLKELRIAKIDYIIGYDLQSNKVDYLSEICKEFGVKRVYLPTNITYDYSRILGVDVQYCDELTCGKYKYKFVFNSGDRCVGLFDVSRKVLFSNSSNSNEDNVQMLNNVDDVKYLVANRINVSETLLDEIDNVILYNGSMESNYIDLYRIEKYLLKV